MKRLITLILAAGMLFGAATGASAVDFKAKGQWIFGFGMLNANFTPKVGGNKTYTGDDFAATQRIRLQLDAVASEALSGTVYFEIGDQQWGHNGTGAALGADGVRVEVKRAYLDWIVPNTELKVRMGIQGVTLPNVAGGSAIFDDDVAGITVSYRFNDMVSLTAAWARPYNDNFGGRTNADGIGNIPANYLDNVDIFALMLPLTGDGWKVTPWAAIGMQGVNHVPFGTTMETSTAAMNTVGFANWKLNEQALDPTWRRSSNAYSTAFFAGLPMAYTGLDGWNFELDLNYGTKESDGRYNMRNRANGDIKRVSNSRSGWLVKGLAEYKMDWATPGIFAWYGSGDDGDMKNGSERMPAMAPVGNFTSFMGDGTTGWSIRSTSFGNMGYDNMLSYAGTWGVGLQLKDMSFVENLKHTFRVAYWGGTNDTENAKFLRSYGATSLGYNRSASSEGFYLTTNDYLVEFNLDTVYKMYDNFDIILELGYIANGIDQGTWQRSYKDYNNERFSKGDAYKAALIFNYSF